MSDPARHFAEGQSVRAAVVTVDSAKQRFTIALKQSLAGAPDAAYARSLFADLEAAERIRCDPSPLHPSQTPSSRGQGFLHQARY